ncbi:MAG: GT4 family glycosyltransferase PelF [Nitriliruptorales bacterium]
MNGEKRLKILLTTEGTYPHVVGGVSTWCDQLVREMPELDFDVFALMMNPFLPPSYDLPDNASLIKVPIWGVEEPAEFNPTMSPRRVLMLSAMMDEATAKRDFVPLLRPLLEHVVSPHFDPEYFGHLLYEMHVYFRTHDFRATFRTRTVWETFRDVVLEDCGIDLSQERRWDEVAPEAAPSASEVAARLGQLRRIPLAKGLEASSEGVRVPLLHDASESLRVLYRLLTPLNYEIPESDLVHATAAAFCGLPGIISKIERGTPFLVTEHGVFMREQMLFLGRIGFPYHLRRFFIQLVSAVSRTVYHFADQISPVCAYNARWEAANGARRDQIHVIYNGTSREKFGPRDVPRPKNPTVVMLARLDPLKDIETGLKVADAVKKEIPDVKFLYYGPEPDAAYADRCRDLHKELGLGETWEWKGSTKDPAGALNQGDVVLMTSISEAFPYSVIEAMMCGKSVVSTNVGGVPEAIGDLGHTARIRDVAGLARGIVETLRLPAEERDRVAAACRQRAVDLFTIEEALREYRDTYLLLGSGVHQPLVRLVQETPAAATSRSKAPMRPLRPAAPGPAEVLAGESIHGLPEAMRPVPRAEEPAAAEREEIPVAWVEAQPEKPPVLAPAPAPAAPLVPVLETAEDVRHALLDPSAAMRLVGVEVAADILELPETVRLLSRMLRTEPATEVRMAVASELGVLLGAQRAEAV